MKEAREEKSMCGGSAEWRSSYVAGAAGDYRLSTTFAVKRAEIGGTFFFRLQIVLPLFARWLKACNRREHHFHQEIREYLPILFAAVQDADVTVPLPALSWGKEALVHLTRQQGVSNCSNPRVARTAL